MTSSVLAPVCHAQLPTAAAVTLMPGDVARIAVWKHPEFTGEFVIGPDGSITHPLFRSIKVTGLQLTAVEDRIREFLTRYDAEPAFSFLPLQRIYVVGEVRVPNTYTVPPGTTVAQAIALAGGPGPVAKLDDVRLVRGDVITRIDLNRPDMVLARAEVRSGDQIVINRSRNILQTYVGPISSVIAALATITAIAIQLSRP